MKFPWECPKCAAKAHAHGKGGKTACKYTGGLSGSCEGLICECEGGTGKNHGQTEDDVCEDARCYHCGWGGRMPPTAIDPKKLKGWKKKAWDAGWRPTGKA